MKTSSSQEFHDLPHRSLLTPSEVADFFQVKPRTVRGWIETGYIGSVRLRGNRRIPVGEVIRIFNSTTEE